MEIWTQFTKITRWRRSLCWEIRHVKIRPGYYRAQLEGQTQFLGNSTQIIIEYDDELEIYDIINENISDGVYSMILPNLDERSYEFTVTTQDEIGNLSVSQL